MSSDYIRGDFALRSAKQRVARSKHSVDGQWSTGDHPNNYKKKWRPSLNTRGKHQRGLAKVNHDGEETTVNELSDEI